MRELIYTWVIIGASKSHLREKITDLSKLFERSRGCNFPYQTILWQILGRSSALPSILLEGRLQHLQDLTLRQLEDPIFSFRLLILKQGKQMNKSKSKSKIAVKAFFIKYEGKNKTLLKEEK